MKRFQVFIHKHYETIKLILLVLIFVFAFISIVSEIQKNNRDSAERAEAVKTVLDGDRNVINALKTENDNQTIIINRQFRALCILIFETAGQEGINKLDPESKARCENLGDPTEQEAGLQSQASPATGLQSQQSSGSSSSLPQNNNNGNSQQPENPQTPEEPDNDGVIVDLPLLPKVHIPSPL